jgi:hypothetical protein
MSAPASLTLFGDEQISFPGIHRCAPAPAADDQGAGEPSSPCPGQLAFGGFQLMLADAEPEPCQPSLLPEPLPWELADRSPATPAQKCPDTAQPLRQLRLFPWRDPAARGQLAVASGGWNPN